MRIRQEKEWRVCILYVYVCRSSNRSKNFRLSLKVFKGRVTVWPLLFKWEKYRRSRKKSMLMPVSVFWVLIPADSFLKPKQRSYNSTVQKTQICRFCHLANSKPVKSFEQVAIYFRLLCHRFQFPELPALKQLRINPVFSSALWVHTQPLLLLKTHIWKKVWNVFLCHEDVFSFAFFSCAPEGTVWQVNFALDFPCHRLRH